MKLYQVIFSGELVDGKTTEQVKQSSTEILKLSEKAINTLFQNTATPVVVKKSLSLEQANLYSKKFRQAGIILEIRETEPASVKPAVNPIEPIVSINEVTPQPPVSALTLEPIIKKPQASPTETASQIEPSEDDSAPSPLINLLTTAFQPPILILLTGLALSITYSPLPDGFLRKGFVLGLVILFFGYRFFKARN